MPRNQNDRTRFLFDGFDGFETPKATYTPDIVFDLLAPNLKEAELRVLLYIIRRTFGFKKDSDNISISQMVGGITKIDGTVLDLGTGMAKAGVVRGINGLLEKGIIIAQRNRSKERGNEPTTYTLRFKGAAAQIPLSPKETRGGLLKRQGLVSQRDTQVTVGQVTVLQETDTFSNSLEGDANLQKGNGSKFSKKRDKFETKTALEVDTPKLQQRSRKEGLAPIAAVLTQRAQKFGRRSSKTAPERSSDTQGSGNHHHLVESPPKRARGRPPKAPPQIEWLITEISGEFHDSESSIRSNVSHAARLFKESGRSEGDFAQLVGEARSITKTYDIQKRASGEAGEWGARNKVPYFFSVLKDLLGLKDVPASKTRPKALNGRGIGP